MEKKEKKCYLSLKLSSGSVDSECEIIFWKFKVNFKKDWQMTIKASKITQHAELRI